MVRLLRALKQRGEQRISHGTKANDRHSEEHFAATGPDPGGYLAALWGLPHPVVQAIAYHRIPGACEEQAFGPLTTVHVAHALMGPPEESTDGGLGRLDMDYLHPYGP
jgi:HD-like signal output (HDOD) protein